jgi:hypothetical protein
VKIRTCIPVDDDLAHRFDVVVVYLFNSAQNDHRDEEADLDIFRVRDTPKNDKGQDESSHRITSMKQACLNAVRTENATATSSFRVAPTQSDDTTPGASRSLPPTRVLEDHCSMGMKKTWLNDPNMFPPGSRVTTFGYDVRLIMDKPLDVEGAGAFLYEELVNMRRCSTTPILLLGHIYGGLILLRALVSDAASNGGTEVLVGLTAGIFLFQLSPYGSAKRISETSKLLGLPSEARLLSEFGWKGEVEKCFNAFDMAFCEDDIQNYERLRHIPPDELSRNSECLQLRPRRSPPVKFEIVSYLTETEEFGDPKLTARGLTTIGRLEVRILTNFVGEGAVDGMMRFSGPADLQWLKVTNAMLGSMKTYSILDAAYSGALETMSGLIRAEPRFGIQRENAR